MKILIHVIILLILLSACNKDPKWEEKVKSVKVSSFIEELEHNKIIVPILGSYEVTPESKPNVFDYYKGGNFNYFYIAVDDGTEYVKYFVIREFFKNADTKLMYDQFCAASQDKRVGVLAESTERYCTILNKRDIYFKFAINDNYIYENKCKEVTTESYFNCIITDKIRQYFLDFQF